MPAIPLRGHRLARIAFPALLLASCSKADAPAPDANASQAAIERQGIRGSLAVVRPDGTQLAQIARLIDEGKVTSYRAKVKVSFKYESGE